MATLLFTAVGTAIGGPVGGALGAFLGRQVDMAAFGSGTRQGPRLRELAISTSSYGQPIARHFGRMRVPGTIIWSTDLIETRRKDKGRKGQPSTVSYSYTASFAVALSSTPVARLGRVWADGNLLRGARDDLKISGTLRFYQGFGDDPVDPLIAADQGAGTPAFRDCAYVVFENLDLSEFGNRIPALSFEIIADGGDGDISLGQLVPLAETSDRAALLANARGFADEGGPLISTLATIDQVIPLVCTSGSGGLQIAARMQPDPQVIDLPEQLSTREPGGEPSRHKQRAGQALLEPTALRYYDEDRDYQPGVQRAIGTRRTGREVMVDLPATMTAGGARQLANDSANRARWQHETVTWRIGELDPRLQPGVLARIPDAAGLWLVRSWEWLDRGIELELERVPPGQGPPIAGDPGAPLLPVDEVIAPTRLAAFEVPPDEQASAAAALVYAAVSADRPSWRGAALYAVEGEALVPLDVSGTQRAVVGEVATPVPPSPALLFEPAAALMVELYADDLDFPVTDMAGLAAGANRLLVGGEVLQFAAAIPLGNRRWELKGLLRGRAGTEPQALAGHPLQTPAILLDDRLVALDPALVPPFTGTRVAAIGTRDTEPVVAALANPGLSRRPLIPVHPKLVIGADEVWDLSWTRRARGQWRWDAAVEMPIVEEREAYMVGYGPVTSPFVVWLRSENSIRLTASDRAALRAAHGPGTIWVKQIGTFDQSAPLLLSTLA